MSSRDVLHRRAFLAAAAALAIGVPSIGGWWWATRVRLGDTSPLVTAILRHHLGWMNVEGGAFERFAREFIFGEATSRAAWLGVAGPVVSLSAGALPSRLGGEAFRRLEEVVVEGFLLSTDFFRTEGPEDRPVRYQGLYDPFLRPASNPLADRTLHPCEDPPQLDLYPSQTAPS